MSQMVLDKNKFKCNKCKQVLELKHLVWFVKHYKYCGVDNETAMQILSLTDTEDLVSNKTKKNSRDIDVLHVKDSAKLKEISKLLLGKVAESVWGCIKCYKAFDSESALLNHRNMMHDAQVSLLNHCDLIVSFILTLVAVPLQN